MIESQYISQKLEQAGQTTLADNYTRFISDNNGRLCNDGYPDARNPLTNSFSIRLVIAMYRQQWKRTYPSVLYVRNSAKKHDRKRERAQYELGYNHALNDVMDSLHSKPTISVTERIANLRSIINKAN